MDNHLFSDLLFVLCSSETLATGSEVRLADSALLKRGDCTALAFCSTNQLSRMIISHNRTFKKMFKLHFFHQTKYCRSTWLIIKRDADDVRDEDLVAKRAKVPDVDGANQKTRELDIRWRMHGLFFLMQDWIIPEFEDTILFGKCAHFAIYDGHGGRMAAEYAQKHLHANVLAAGLPRELMDVKAAKRAILEGFQRTDESLLQESLQGNWQDGATAVCVWVLQQMVFIANIGDAKAVLARGITSDGTQTSANNAGIKAIVLTREHKAIYPQERTRIQKAGGTITNGRLQGRIEVSRAFGDRHFKKVGVIATPDVHSFELTERDHFIILGCDGLWGVFGPSDAADFVQKQLKETSSAAIAARRLVRESVRERRCKDNCTAIVVVFKHSGPM
ncbi:hypothetical protein HPP92_010196 [Vanilla planifolia]|uniref:protein-serine/threonine phosphatase n=1 Tax=Vanilla planifolia TaxID=51239 RepID=A0A835QWQ2_VANPL|nr:hypothetical protein HPP92_010196 [Vanilla planifolia]